MDHEDNAGRGRRFSRRQFNAACQVAIAPIVLKVSGVSSATAEDREETSKSGPDAEQFQRCVDRAIRYLQSQGQAQDGSFSTQAGIGITSLIITGVLRHGRSASDPFVARSLNYLENALQPGHGNQMQGALYANYEISLAITCLNEANRDNRYDRLIRKAEALIRKSQWCEDAGKDSSDLSYGGAGYGKHKRPDLSNTAYFIDALKECGSGQDDPAMQKALTFVSRCQNLETEYNTTPQASKNPDGGFFYTCVGGGNSPAGKTENGGLRSYGSMTYSGLKSMIYAGIKGDDPRVKAAVDWIRANYDLQSNPGLGNAGLYYYYHVFAKTLDAIGAKLFEDKWGWKHDWRGEVAEELIGRQKENGSWINDNAKWMEGDPNLVTGYALLALSYCRPG